MLTPLPDRETDRHMQRLRQIKAYTGRDSLSDRGMEMLTQLPDRETDRYRQRLRYIKAQRETHFLREAQR